MDPREIVKRKVIATQRIKSSLDLLSKEFGFSLEAAGAIRARVDPDLVHLFDLERIADVVDTILEAARQKKEKVSK